MLEGGCNHPPTQPPEAESKRGAFVDEAVRILLYGLIAAASVLAMSATIAVLKSGHGRVNGIIFATAFLIGESLVMGLVLIVGSFTIPTTSTATAILELLVGVALIVLARRVRRQAPVPRQKTKSERTQAVMDRLDRLTPLTAFSVGGLLGIGGPKRLTLALIAAGTIAAADLAADEQFGLAVLYVVVAGVLVWAPVLAYVLAGARAETMLEDAQAWLKANQRQVAVWSLFVVGAVFIVDASVRLLA